MWLLLGIAFFIFFNFIFNLGFTRTEENFIYILLLIGINLIYSWLFNKSLLSMRCFIFNCGISPDFKFIESRFEIFQVSFTTYFRFECNLK